MAILLAPIALTGGKALVERFANLSDEGVQGDLQVVGRIVSWTTALQDIAQHPIIGNGTASFQLLADAREVPILGDSPWVGNSPLRILHDTGLIGLLLMGVVAISTGAKAKKALALRQHGRDIVIALAAGCFVYLIAFMSTEGTMLSFFWVHVGLLASACSFATGETPPIVADETR